MILYLDADLVEELEDRYWAKTADKALAAMTRNLTG